MIIVHDIFICKPGNASKVAKLFKEVMADNDELVNIMTDMTGQYNKVVMVSRYENLAAYEKSFEKYMQDVINCLTRLVNKIEKYYISGLFQFWGNSSAMFDVV
ncbi:MAG TPA: hypothetical protein VN958_14625 [Chitinophagaceae bacterium]|nr:hypothetical protein [Chitinophagaceae bacterium]